MEKAKEVAEQRLKEVEKENEDLRGRILHLTTQSEKAQKILTKAAERMFGKYTDTVTKKRKDKSEKERNNHFPLHSRAEFSWLSEPSKRTRSASAT